MTRAQLTALAERVMGLTGPCIATDHEIAQAVRDLPAFRPRYTLNGPPAYTASLDAAMSLVPEGWFVDLRFRPQSLIDQHPAYLRMGEAAFTHPTKVENHIWRRVQATTPALALTAAALLARAAECEE